MILAQSPQVSLQVKGAYQLGTHLPGDDCLGLILLSETKVGVFDLVWAP